MFINKNKIIALIAAILIGTGAIMVPIASISAEPAVQSTGYSYTWEPPDQTINVDAAINTKANYESSVAARAQMQECLSASQDIINAMTDGSIAQTVLDNMTAETVKVTHSFDSVKIQTALTTCQDGLGTIQQYQIDEQNAAEALLNSNKNSATISTNSSSVSAGTQITASTGGWEVGVTSWYDDGGLARNYGYTYGTASTEYPHGTILKVSYGGNTITCVVSDSGPYISGRVLDLNYAAASALGIISSGVATVSYTLA